MKHKGLYRVGSSEHYSIKKSGPFDPKKKGQKGNFWHLVSEGIHDAAGISVRSYREVAEKMLVHARNRLIAGRKGDGILPLCPTTRKQWEGLGGRAQHSPLVNTGGFVSSMGIRMRPQQAKGLNFSFGWYSTTRPDLITGNTPHGFTTPGPNSPGGQRYSDLARLFKHGKKEWSHAPKTAPNFSFIGMKSTDTGKNVVKPKTRQYPTQYLAAQRGRPHAWGFPPRILFPSPEEMQKALFKEITERQKPGRRIPAQQIGSSAQVELKEETGAMHKRDGRWSFGATATQAVYNNLTNYLKSLIDPHEQKEFLDKVAENISEQQYNELHNLFGLED